MSVDQSWLVPAEDLQLGTSLTFDLIDSDGHLLYKAGTTIDDQLVTQLHERRVQSFKVHEARQEKLVTPKSVLLHCYSEATIQSIQTSFLKARTSLLRLLASLQENDDTHLEPASASIGEFMVQVKSDIAASLAVISLNSATPSAKVIEKIASHSANMAMLSIAMSTIQKDDPIISYQLGLAALLHDSSLLLNSDWFETEAEARDEAFRKKYRRHPIESADFFNDLPGISKPVLMMMMEVHEQADGTGYPRGLQLSEVRLGSEILNLADAYLTLTSPVQGRTITPADALGYLCYHAAKGKFSKDAVHLLTKCLSMYPIGSSVELDDLSTAVVVRVNSERPMTPVVRLLHTGHREIDLGESSQFISGPHISDQIRTERLSRARLHEVLWKTDR